MQSFQQAISCITGKLVYGAPSDGLSFEEWFVADAPDETPIGLALLANLAASWDAIVPYRPFLFINRDSSKAILGVGVAEETTPLSKEYPAFVAREFAAGSETITFTPRVVVQTSRERWPEMSLMVCSDSRVSDTVGILERLCVSFRSVRSAAFPIPACLGYADTGMKKEEYLGRVNEDLVAIRKEELEKVVYSRRVTYSMSAEVNPAALLHRIVAETEASDCGKRYVVLYHSGDSTFVSVTPERLCRVTSEVLETEALAGTCSNSVGFELADPKLTHEHDSVSKYIVGKLRELSSLPVTIEGRELLCLRNMTHCRQQFRVTLDRGGSWASPASLIDWALTNLHPTPAVCGLPVNLASSLIAEHEKFDRGLFAAPIGVFNASEGEVCVGLRSALVEGSTVNVFAGAGVVAGSCPNSEWAEMSLKMTQFDDVLRGEQTHTGALWNPPNATYAMAEFVVEELIRQSVSRIIVCPGSRSTPLTVAVHRNPEARKRVLVVHDERAAGFYALGIARAGGLPAIIVTSGTAVANLLPAVCEAGEAGGSLPLLLLTADRPSDSWHTGESQTVKQVGLFGNYCLFEKSFPAPHSEAVELLASRQLKSIIADVAFACSKRGVVHLNFEIHKSELGGHVPGFASTFNQHLHPKLRKYVESARPFCMHSVGRKKDFEFPAPLITALETGRCLVVCGALEDPNDAIALSAFCNQRKVPCFADAASMLLPSDWVCLGVDQLMGNDEFKVWLSAEFGLVLRVGGALISARLQEWAPAAVIRVRDDETCKSRHDPQCLADMYFHVGLGDFLVNLEKQLTSFSSSRRTCSLSESIRTAYSAVLPLVTPSFNEALIARIVSEQSLKMGTAVFLSSSMPCRDYDIFGTTIDPPRKRFFRRVAANRGANGIDGVIATALGYCHGTGTDTNLLIGDVATLHDLGAVTMVLNAHPGNLPEAGGRHLPQLKIVCINNSGGAIFSFLPIKQQTDVFTPYFDTPHNQNFCAIVNAMRPGSAVRVRDRPALEAALNDPTIRFVECVGLPNHEDNVILHKEIGRQVAERVLKSFKS